MRYFARRRTWSGMSLRVSDDIQREIFSVAPEIAWLVGVDGILVPTDDSYWEESPIEKAETRNWY